MRIGGEAVDFDHRRAAVKEWRKAGCAGAPRTTRALLQYGSGILAARNRL